MAEIASSCIEPRWLLQRAKLLPSIVRAKRQRRRHPQLRCGSSQSAPRVNRAGDSGRIVALPLSEHQACGPDLYADRWMTRNQRMRSAASSLRSGRGIRRTLLNAVATVVGRARLSGRANSSQDLRTPILLPT